MVAGIKYCMTAKAKALPHEWASALLLCSSSQLQKVAARLSADTPVMDNFHHISDLCIRQGTGMLVAMRNIRHPHVVLLASIC